MPRRNSGYRHGPGALRVFFYSILATNLPRPVAATSFASNVTIDDASSSGRFYTPPLTSSTVPPGSNDTVARWVNQACSGCSSMPDLKQLQNGTFTELYLPAGNNFTYDISFGFNGMQLGYQGEPMCSLTFFVTFQGQQSMSISSSRTKHPQLVNLSSMTTIHPTQKRHRIHTLITYWLSQRLGWI